MMVDAERCTVATDGPAKYETVAQAIEQINLAKVAEGTDDADEAIMVKHLQLSCADVNPETLPQLTEALRGYKSLESINLSWTHLSSTSFQELAIVLAEMEKLTHVDLKYTEMNREGAEVVAQILKTNKSITELDIVNNSIRSSGAEVIAEALKENNTLRELRLGSNDISDDGAVAMAEALKSNTSLTLLEMGTNDVTSKGADSLATTLVDNNSTLEVLELQCNAVGDFGAQRLSEVLASNTTIKRLDLKQNGITDTGASALMEALKASEGPAYELDLSDNDLTSDMHTILDEESLPGLVHSSSEDDPFQDSDDQNGAGGLSGASGMDGEDFEEAFSPPDVDDLQASMSNPTTTVQRMLGLIEDQDDAAFDNANWYFSQHNSSYPEMAETMWTMAMESGEEPPMVRCIHIFDTVLTELAQNQPIHSIDDPSGLPSIVLFLFNHIPQITQILSKPPAERVTLNTTFGAVEERFGLLRMHTVDLLCSMLETRCVCICDAIAKSGALQIIFDKFFTYAWNSALHSKMLMMVEIILDAEDQQVTRLLSLQKCLLAPAPEGCGFLTRLMDAYDETTPDAVEVKELDTPAVENQDPPEVEAIIVEQKLVAASKNVGYMSAVMDMAGCFKKARQNVLALGELVDEVQQANTTNADENARWEIFCTEILERSDDVSPEKRCLGGERPRHNPTCGQM